MQHTYYTTCPYCGANLDPGEIAKFQLNQPGGVRGWFTRLCYQGETDDKVTE